LTSMVFCQPGSVINCCIMFSIVIVFLFESNKFLLFLLHVMLGLGQCHNFIFEQIPKYLDISYWLTTILTVAPQGCAMGTRLCLFVCLSVCCLSVVFNACTSIAANAYQKTVLPDSYVPVVGLCTMYVPRKTPYNHPCFPQNVGIDCMHAQYLYSNGGQFASVVSNILITIDSPLHQYNWSPFANTLRTGRVFLNRGLPYPNAYICQLLLLPTKKT